MYDNVASEYEKRIKSVINYMETVPKQDLSLKALAEKGMFSPYHFHRIFKAFTGETPIEYLSRIRVQKAASLLKYNKERTITDIALAAGYDNSSSFSRSFKNYYGVSPSKFRKNQEGTELKQHIKGSPDPSISCEVVISYFNKIPLYFVLNRKGYIEDAISAAWEELLEYASKFGLFTHGTQLIGISFDNPEFTELEKCRYYACITKPAGKGSIPGLGVYHITEGYYAVLETHVLPTEIGSYYDYFYRKWFPESGYFPANKPGFDIYLSRPEQHSEGKIKMKICLPVDKK